MKSGFEKGLEAMRKMGKHPDIITSQAKAGEITIYHSSEGLVKVSKADTPQVNSRPSLSQHLYSTAR